MWTLQIFIDPHPSLIGILLYILATGLKLRTIDNFNLSAVYMQTGSLQLKKTLNYSSFIPLLQFDFEVSEIIIYFTAFFASVFDVCGPSSKLAETYFSDEEYTNMSLYNLHGIRSKHRNISNRGMGVVYI